MTTLEQLRNAVNAVNIQVNELVGSVSKLNNFMRKVSFMIDPANSFAETINVDQFIALQTPIYNTLVNAMHAEANDIQPV